MSQVEAPNSLRTWKFGGYTHYAKWSKVADALIEAKSMALKSNMSRPG
jgi:hypothetical protein